MIRQFSHPCHNRLQLICGKWKMKIIIVSNEKFCETKLMLDSSKYDLESGYTNT